MPEKFDMTLWVSAVILVTTIAAGIIITKTITDTQRVKCQDECDVLVLIAYESFFLNPCQ